MAEDILKPAGSTKASKPDAGGGVIRNVPVIGIVKNNIDPTRAGRIQVYISDLGSDDPDNPDGWATVAYMSPFYGFVQPTAPDTGDGDYVANPASYGMWYSPPDLETEVVCVFINGDPNYGFYIGAIPKPEALHMVPAIGASENIITNNSSESTKYGGATSLPVTNINTNNEQTATDNNFLDLPKPVHSYQAAIFFKQGLIRDTIRGPITSSANRESPSRVGWGVSSPGRPIYAGGYTDSSVATAALDGTNDQGLSVISRQGGHSIVLDDGDLIGRNNLLRLRSSAGHQITMSDDGQTLFIIHSNGQSYIELGKEGTIDMFSTNSVNIRTQGDLNLHADNDINIHAKKKLNIKAEDIYMFSEKNTSHRIGKDYKIETVGKYNLKVAGIMSLSSGDTASFASGGTTYINGSQINLNTGQGPEPASVDPLNDKPTTDTLFESEKGYIAAPGQLKTIVSRAPAHTPWAHANQGVNVGTSPAAEDNLPSSPSPEATEAIDAASASPTSNPLTPAALSSVPSVPPVSESLDSTTTGSLIGAAATNAATGPAAAAVAAGAGVIQTASGPAAALGQLAQTPSQLDQAGILKPGSSVLADSLIKNGNPLASSLPPNLFTGKDGATSLGAFVSNPAAQVSSMVTNMQQAQTSLTNAGLLTGKEDPSSMAGLVLAGTTVGVGGTLDAVKNSVVGKVIPNAGLPGVTSSVSNAINSGKSAAGLAQTSTGGLGPIFSAVAAMGGLTTIAKGGSKGITAAAIGAIAASLTPLPNRTPVNLRAVGRENMALAEARSLGVSNVFGQATDLLKLAGRLGGPEVSRVTNAVSGGLTSVDKLLNAQTTAQTIGGITSVVGSIGRIGSVTGNKSIANTARQVNSVVNATNQISKALTGIGNATSLQQQLGGIGRIAGTLGAVGSVFGNKSLIKNTAKLSQLSRNSSNILNAVDKLITSKNINSTLGAVGSIVTSASRIKGLFSNSQKASGMSMLPGGSLSVSSIVNRSLGKLGIPKNPALTSIISNAATAAINNIAFPKSIQGAKAMGSSISGGLTSAATGAFSNIQKDITGTLSGIQSAGGGLMSAALDKLSPGAAGSLNAAIGSIGFGGAGALQLPVIGENTFDDTSVSSAIGGLLEDPRIPDPVYTDDPDPAGLAALEAAIEQNNQIDDQLILLSQLQQEVDQAKEEYLAIEASLPPGDPLVDEYRIVWIELQSKANQLLSRISQIINY